MRRSYCTLRVLTPAWSHPPAGEPEKGAAGSQRHSAQPGTGLLCECQSSLSCTEGETESQSRGVQGHARTQGGRPEPGLCLSLQEGLLQSSASVCPQPPPVRPAESRRLAAEKTPGYLDLLFTSLFYMTTVPCFFAAGFQGKAPALVSQTLPPKLGRWTAQPVVEWVSWRVGGGD